MKRFLTGKKFIIFIIFLIVVAFFGKNVFLGSSTQKKEKPYKVKRQTLKETLSLSGEIDADEKATLRFQSSGKLVWVGVKQGDLVEKNQGIAALDKREIEMKLKKYLNTFLDSRWSFDQTKEDNRESVIGSLTEEQRRKALRLVDRAQFDLNNAILDVELQNMAEEFAYLSTPIDGIVTVVDAPTAGVNIAPTQAEFEIINPATVYFSISADQTEVIKLFKGQMGKVTYDAYPDDVKSGTITNISFIPKSGETGTVYEVKMGMSEDNSLARYKIGMTGDVEFVLKEKQNVIAIPISYVRTEKGKSYVLKSKNGTDEKTFITTGDTTDELAEVTSGLKEGDVIHTYDSTP